MNRLLLAGLLSSLLLSACGKSSDQEAPSVRAKRGDLVFSGSFFGELVARESEMIHTPNFRGWGSYTVKTVLPDGKWVKKGDVVLTFVRDTTENELREEQAKLAVAEAAYKRTELKLAQELIELEVSVKQKELQMELDRLDVVRGVNLISKLNLEKAKLELGKSELNLKTARKALKAFARKSSTTLRVEQLRIDQIKSKLKEVKERLAKLTIYAPKEGVIYGPFTQMNWVRGKCSPGSVTRSGDKLLEIPDFSAYNVKFSVRQRDAGYIDEGSTVTVIASVLPDKKFRAVVKKKAAFTTTRNERMGTSTPEGNLKEIEIVAELDTAPAELRPGGTATVIVDALLKKNALVVPLAAVKEEEEKVWVACAGKGKREVKLGQISTTHAEVLEGLKDGEAVILQ